MQSSAAAPREPPPTHNHHVSDKMLWERPLRLQAKPPREAEEAPEAPPLPPSYQESVAARLAAWREAAPGEPDHVERREAPPRWWQLENPGEVADVA